MRSLKKNTIKIYYSLYLGEDELKDEAGNYTGEYGAIYASPVPIYINVSSPSGESGQYPFGSMTEYDRILCTASVLPIDEKTLIWIGRTPEQKHNYEVKKVAPSLNSVVYALKEVKVENNISQS